MKTFFGGKLDWAFFDKIQEYLLVLQYYIKKECIKLLCRIVYIKYWFYSSGFIHSGRGRHSNKVLNSGRWY